MADAECYRCKEVKDSSFDFYWGEEKRHRWCKDCVKEYAIQWHRARRERLDMRATERLK